MQKMQVVVRELATLLRAFSADTSGVFAVTFGLMAIVLLATGGAAVDYTFWMSARSAAQHAADTGSLAAAVSREVDESKLKTIAAGYGNPHLKQWPDVLVRSLVYSAATDRVEVTVSGSVPTYFVTLLGIHTLPVQVSAVAERAANGRLELALVLDNTWSMSEDDGAGSTKIAALKRAANDLLDELLADDKASIKIGVVPYAEYVNIGVGNRNQPWMKVPPDSTTPRVCETRTTRRECPKSGPPKTCKRIVDGVEETYDCTPTKCTDYEVPPYQYCTGGGKSTFHGCVMSRNIGDLRLSDREPYTPYPGMVSGSKTCLNPIIPLTSSYSAVRQSLNSMQVQSGSYRPYTYIPGGLVWGINVLSPTVPFDQGAPYDKDNLKPKKVLILMTDGDNTRKYEPSDGQHVPFNGNAQTSQSQKRQTDKDTEALCDYAKDQGIEVFTVAFGKLAPQSDKMLMNCATSGKHYYNAIDSTALRAAFSEIGGMLTDIRLVR